MTFRNLATLLACAFASLGVPPHKSFAGDTLDLKRTAPVPAAQPIPIMDFFRPRLVENPTLNSTGSHIAAVISTGEDRHDLLIYNVRTSKAEVLSTWGDKDVYSLHWLDERKLVFELSAKKMYGIALYAADLGRALTAYPLLQYYGSSLIGVPRNNRLRPLVWNQYDALERGAQHDRGVAEIDADLNIAGVVDLNAAGTTSDDVGVARATNERHIVRSFPQPESGQTVYYVADREGQLAYAGTLIDGAVTLQRLAENRWTKCPIDMEQISIVGCGNESGQLTVAGPRQNGKPRALQFMDAATGALGEVLLQDQEYDFNGGLYRHPATNEILGAAFTRDGPEIFWFSEQYRKLQKMLNARFPGQVVRILDSDDAQKFFLVVTFSDRQPAIYHWVDLEKHAAGLFRSSAPWIEPSRMQPTHILRFSTRDGHQLVAYLTLPAGSSKQSPPPLLVVPHGGPWARDSWGFDPEAQFFASRGYAVLKPNYRGSTGTDWKFAEEDRYDFLKMQNDVIDATKAVVSDGLVDGRRIGIMGGSFGGYLAIGGVVQEPALYRCAITNAGVFDWAELIREKKNLSYETSAWLRRRIGDPKQQADKFEAISPLRHVDQIRVPVFVAGGKDDTNVEITQSKRLIAALKKNHVVYEKLLVSEEGHGMRHLANQVELYSRIEAFLDHYLKPVPPAAAERADAKPNGG